MRLWSLHAKYLGAAWLTGVWREALLAQKVLQGATRGYRNHPQLMRFRKQPDPLAAIGAYLHYVHEEAQRRGYHFDRSRIAVCDLAASVPVTIGQLVYELEHLRGKMASRGGALYDALQGITVPDPLPLFRVVEGEVEAWEVRHPWR
jgi:hypothetical protein